MKSTLRHKAITQTKQLFVYAGKTGDGFDEDNIHELRTHFKKIRALLRWQHANKRSYTIFNEVYQQAGKIRNIQVVQEMLKHEAGIPADFKQWLNHKLSVLKKEWHFRGFKKMKKKLVRQVKNVKFVLHKKFFPHTVAVVKKAAAKRIISDTDMHEMRKKIKDTQYAADWWKKNSGSSTATLQKLPLAELKKMATQIGAYNDRATLITLFKIYLVTKKVLVNQNNLVNKWQQEKLLFKKYLIEKIRRIVNKKYNYPVQRYQ